MRFRTKRHLVLLNNLAHLEVPGYRAQDLNVKAFQQMLSEAIQDRAEGRTSTLVLGSTDGFEASPAGTFRPVAEEVLEGPVRHDGNTVGLERQMSKLMKNAMHIRVLSQLVDRSYRSLEEAWRGRTRG